MPKCEVSIPFSGYTIVEVEAEDSEAAVEAAWAHPDMTIENCHEVEFHDRLCYGNVCLAGLKSIQVEIIK